MSAESVFDDYLLKLNLRLNELDRDDADPARAREYHADGLSLEYAAALETLEQDSQLARATKKRCAPFG